MDWFYKIFSRSYWASGPVYGSAYWIFQVRIPLLYTRIKVLAEQEGKVSSVFTLYGRKAKAFLAKIGA